MVHAMATSSIRIQQCALVDCVLTLMVSIVILNQQMLNIPGWQIGLISTGSGVGLLSGSFSDHSPLPTV